MFKILYCLTCPKLTKFVIFWTHFMNEETKMCRSQLLISYDLVVLGLGLELDIFVSIVNQSTFVSKLLLLIAHDTLLSSYTVALHCAIPLHLCHTPASIPYAASTSYPCIYIIPLYLFHTHVSVSHSRPTPVLIVWKDYSLQLGLNCKVYFSAWSGRYFYWIVGQFQSC